MRNILFLVLLVMLVSCNSSSDKNNPTATDEASKIISANPDLTGTWEVQYNGGGQDYTKTELIKIAGKQIFFQENWYYCLFDGKSALWEFTTTNDYHYMYDITMKSKDEFDGKSSLVIAGQGSGLISMTGKRK